MHLLQKSLHLKQKIFHFYAKIIAFTGKLNNFCINAQKLLCLYLQIIEFNYNLLHLIPILKRDENEEGKKIFLAYCRRITYSKYDIWRSLDVLLFSVDLIWWLI